MQQVVLPVLISFDKIYIHVRIKICPLCFMSKERKSNLLSQLEKNLYCGFFIDVEGLDGSGQSTQIKKLKNYFKENNLNFLIIEHLNQQTKFISALKNN